MKLKQIQEKSLQREKMMQSKVRRTTMRCKMTTEWLKKMTAGGCKTYSFELRWYYSILSFSGSYLYYVVQYHLCQSNYINIVL